MRPFWVRWGVVSIFLLALSAASFGQIAVGISVRIGPPALPVYAQPICPGPGFIWTPGYWAWNDDGGYYWVPGTWVVAPVGMYWTPGYWGWGGGFYAWHAGYWGRHVGFYGGINYGFGYGGVGFVGGEWRGGGFYYNRSVTNVSVTNVTNVYNRTVVVNNTTVNNVSYNGGSGGVTARPTPQEDAYSREPHTAPLALQTQHEKAAAQNRQNFASENHGRPAIAATARPADFSSRSAVAARAAGAEYHPPAISPREARVAPNAHSSTNAGARNSSNEGFRPFTPPVKNNSPNGAARNTYGATNNKTHNNQGSNGNRPNHSQSSGGHPAPQSHEASQPAPHSSNPPAHHQNAPKEERPHGKR